MNKLIATTITAGIFLLAPVMNASASCGSSCGAHAAAGGCSIKSSSSSNASAGCCSITSSKSSNVSEETLARFNKETTTLREKLIDVCSQLNKEQIKTQPDPDTMAKLQKEMIDIQADIQKIANKYGVANVQCSGCKSKGNCSH